jgi:TRAP-type C4-dicarboxylate transport system substrate-binding protein
VLGAGALVAGCSQNGGGGLRSDIKVGMSTPADALHNGAYAWVAACIAVLEEAGLTTRVYPNSAIGGERERTIQTQMGLLELNLTGNDEVNRWSPLSYASARPFLVDSYAHMDRFLDQTPYLERISADLAPHGLRLVDYVYTGSMVGLFTRGRPVRNLDDMRALRLRVLSAADMDLLHAWDVRGVQVAWEEVAQALQTGMVDAYLNPPNIAPLFGHGSVLDYFTDLRMGPAARLVVASTRWLDSLGARDRDVLELAFAAGRAANRSWIRDTIARDRARLEEIGIEWVVPTAEQRHEWVEASEAIHTGRWEDPAVTTEFLQWLDETREGPE